MLRMYVIQQILGLSDEGTEDALYDSQSVRTFVGLDLSREAAPDATTLLKFRRLLERHELTRRMFETINADLADQGLFLKQGTVVDATLVAAAPSTKNQEKARDPEMKQTKKGNQWYFGMKTHVGADAATGLVHSVAVSSANESDVAHVHELLHGEESLILADAGYTGAAKREEVQHLDGVTWCIAAKPGQLKSIPEWSPWREVMKDLEHAKASARSAVEHVFHVMKCRFGYRKVRYKGLAKNRTQMFSLLGLGNLLLAGRWLSAT
jgi:IS5 family transposase